MADRSIRPEVGVRTCPRSCTLPIKNPRNHVKPHLTIPRSFLSVSKRMVIVVASSLLKRIP